MKTYFPTKKAMQDNRKWLIIDATDQVVGRLATKVANILRGKKNPAVTPHLDSGDFVVVINAEKVRFTGQKWENKMYRHHTGYIGHLKEETAKRVRDRHPEDIIREAVKGMLPKNTLGREQALKLKVYTGSNHPHMAQKPIAA